ncbi:MAG: VOC family protein [Flavisolibacter sp.]|nr:VOC family protein [Flavisolibacter sp.]
MQLTPYIMFNGNCEEALNFYAQAFNGEIKDLMRFEGSPVANMSADKQKIMHAHFAVNGNSIFMAADGGQGEANATKGGMVHLSINFNNASEQERVFNALSEGGQVSMPLQDTFWGARFGMLMDKFGVNWMFNYDKQQS